jgi:hypothetical protein
MTDLIPAGPGWYVREHDGHTVTLDPIVAWKPGTDSDDDTILLPLVGGGPKAPVILLDAESLENWDRTIVYRPNHDPGAVCDEEVPW